MGRLKVSSRLPAALAAKYRAEGWWNDRGLVDGLEAAAQRKPDALAVAASLAVPAWLTVNPAPSTTFLAGSGGVLGATIAISARPCARQAPCSGVASSGGRSGTISPSAPLATAASQKGPNPRRWTGL